ncbi:MAG: response regulator [bacterium]
MKILVVDDSSVMRRILINSLKQIDLVDIDQADNGEDAVTKALAGDYGLILLDWHLPNMLGIDALKEIRAKGKTMPIIMVTTESEKPSVIQALRAGASNYVTKPFTSERVIEKIRETLTEIPPKAIP